MAQFSMKAGLICRMGAIMVSIFMPLGEDYVRLGLSTCIRKDTAQGNATSEIVVLTWDRPLAPSSQSGKDNSPPSQGSPGFGHSTDWWEGTLDSMFWLSITIQSLQRSGSSWYLWGWVACPQDARWHPKHHPTGCQSYSPFLPLAVFLDSHIPQGVWLRSAEIHWLEWNRTVIYDAQDKTRPC